LNSLSKAYEAIMTHLKNGPWYVDVDMYQGAVVWPLFNSLQAFWPGLQVLYGDIEEASNTAIAFHSVWKRYGFLPEAWNLVSGEVNPGQGSYPLRPELAESLYYLYVATRDPKWLSFGRDMIHSINTITRVECGFASIEHVATHQLRDHMESFLLAETLKYLYLLFDSAIEEEPLVDGKYIFTTEGHPLPIRKEWQVPLDNSTLKAVGFCPEQSFLGKIAMGNFDPAAVSPTIKRASRIHLFNKETKMEQPENLFNEKVAKSSIDFEKMKEMEEMKRRMEIEEFGNRFFEVEEDEEEVIDLDELTGEEEEVDEPETKPIVNRVVKVDKHLTESHKKLKEELRKRKDLVRQRREQKRDEL